MARLLVLKPSQRMVAAVWKLGVGYETARSKLRDDCHVQHSVRRPTQTSILACRRMGWVPVVVCSLACTTSGYSDGAMRWMLTSWDDP